MGGKIKYDRLVSYFVCYYIDMNVRPSFEKIKSFDEFSKYYWYREELVKICRQLGICASGYKAELNKRIEEYFNGKLCGKELKISEKRHSHCKSKCPVKELSLETSLIECDFRFIQEFRDFFSVQTGIKKFKFNADMVASVRKVRETEDRAFTLGDLLDVFYGKKSYAQYDKVSLQWNKFVKDFCADPATAQFSNKLKLAARLWKKVRESSGEKIYRHELLEELKEVQ